MPNWISLIYGHTIQILAWQTFGGFTWGSQINEYWWMRVITMMHMLCTLICGWEYFAKSEKKKIPTKILCCMIAVSNV